LIILRKYTYPVTRTENIPVFVDNRENTKDEIVFSIPNIRSSLPVFSGVRVTRSLVLCVC